VASLFVNRKVYLVIANFNNKEVKVITTDNYVSVIKSKEQTQEQNNWVIKGRSIEILELVSSAVG